MRRGLLKDLTNTPTQIACGWRLYGDLSRLSNQRGAVVIDLLSGQATVERHVVSPPLEVAEAAHGWIRDRFERDGVPHELVVQATLTLSPRSDSRGLTVDCATVIETTQGTFTSSDRATWASGDRRANANRTLLPPTGRADDSVPDVVSVVGNRGALGVDAV